MGGLREMLKAQDRGVGEGRALVKVVMRSVVSWDVTPCGSSKNDI
jgi:hypothetical protein